MRRILISLVGTLSFTAGISNAQVDTAWVRYSPESGIAHDVVSDSEGTVYVAGSTRVIKYTPAGEVIWNTVVGASGGGPFQIHFGAPGEFYTSGATTIRKRGSDGSFLWVRTYSDIGPRGRTADNESYFYVTGTAGTRRYLPDGSVWTQFAVTGSKVAVDANRSLYVMRGSGPDYFLAKLSSDGDSLWQRTYDGPAQSTDDAIDLQLDVNANVYVTGKSPGIGTGNDYATLAYDSSGNLLWLARFASPGNTSDVPVDLEIDQSGGVLVLGNSALVKYDPSGNELWVQSFSGWAGFSPVAMKPDGAGNIHVVGRIGSANNYDFLAFSISSVGVLRWVHRFDETPGTNDVPYAITVSPDGEVYAVGEHTQAGASRYMIIKYHFEVCPDGDLDGWCNAEDDCLDSYDPLQPDYDGDGIGDSCDACEDTDGDGYGYPLTSLSSCELDNCPTLYNPSQSDADGDGIGDACDACTDTDSDSFGDPGFIANTCPDDNCPDLPNRDQRDYDMDSIGDPCDDCMDADGDGFGDPEFSETCPMDNCPALFNIDQTGCFNVGDPIADGVIDVLDVVTSVDYAFRGQMPTVDSTCQTILVGGTDVNCDSATTIVDVVKIIDVAFRNQDGNFCRPCICDCYPSACPEATGIVNLLPHNGSFERHCRATLDGWQPEWELYGHFEPVPKAAVGGGQWALGAWPEWGPAPSIWTDVLNPAPRGIYRLSCQVSWYGSGWCCGAGGEMVLTVDSHRRSLWVGSDTTWTYFELIDTLPAVLNGPLRVWLEGEGSQFGNIVAYDNVILEYFGQADP